MHDRAWIWISDECAQRQRKSVDEQGCRRVTFWRHGRCGWVGWSVLDWITRGRNPDVGQLLWVEVDIRNMLG